MKQILQKTIYLFSIIFLMSFGKMNAQCMNFESQTATASGPDALGWYSCYANLCLSLFNGSTTGINTITYNNTGLPVGNMVLNSSTSFMCDIYDPIGNITTNGCTVTVTASGSDIIVNAVDPVSNPITGVLMSVPTNMICVNFDFATFTNPFTTFTSFQMGAGCPSTPIFLINSFPLPVNLISFEGRKNINNVELTWKTSSETNFQKFEIEYSNNGKNYIKIGDMSAQNKEINEYQFNCQLYLTNLNFYRLKMVDIDGKFEYSKVVSVANEISNEIIILNNPIKSGNELKIISNSAYQIFTIDGSKVYDIQSLKTGIYFVKNKEGKTAKFSIE